MKVKKVDLNWKICKAAMRFWSWPGWQIQLMGEVDIDFGTGFEEMSELPAPEED
jgi:hypothetical protein